MGLEIALNNLKNLIDAHLKFIKPKEMEETLNDHKIIITISKTSDDKEPIVNFKVLKIVKRKPPTITLTQEESNNIRKSKEVMKQDLNAQLLYSLLSKVHITMKQVKVDKLPVQGKEMLEEQIQKVVDDIHQQKHHKRLPGGKIIEIEGKSEE